MKKLLVLLIIIVLGLGALNIYEFFGMQKSANEYQNKQDNYHETLKQEIEKRNELTSLNEELETLKIENIENNKELKIWTNLIEKVENLLK